MMRTPQEPDHNGTVIVSSQVAASTRDELQRRADEGDRTLSAEIRRVLVRAVEQSEEEQS